MNSIHGDWFDISNPVVQFSGSLRSDLFDDMLKKERRTDLCLCLGTSLSGMNAGLFLETLRKKIFFCFLYSFSNEKIEWQQLQRKIVIYLVLNHAVQ